MPLRMSPTGTYHVQATVSLYRQQSHWRPPRGTLTRMHCCRTNAKVERLDGKSLASHAADHPQSVRHLFCRLVAAGIDTTERRYREVVQLCTAP